MPHVSSTFEVGGGAGARTWQWRSAYRISCSSRSSYAMSHVTATQMADVCALSCARELTRECLQVSRRGARGRIQRRQRRGEEEAGDGRGLPDTRATGLPPAFIHCRRHGRRQSSVESRGARAPPRSGAAPLSPPPPLSLSLSLALGIYGGARSGGQGWR
jgi:hypothetical protein